MSGVQVYGYCDANCRHQVLTVDQTADLIQQMAANGFQVPEGFIPATAVNEIREQNTGTSIKLWVGTQAEWDSWTGDKTKIFAIISDDKSLENLINRISKLEDVATGIDKGDIIVPYAAHATNTILNTDGTYSAFTIDENGVLKVGDIIIPQRKVISTEPITVNFGSGENIVKYTLPSEVSEGDIIELEICKTGYSSAKQYIKFVLDNNRGAIYGYAQASSDWANVNFLNVGDMRIGYSSDTNQLSFYNEGYAEIKVTRGENSANITQSNPQSQTGGTYTITKITKIIE